MQTCRHKTGLGDNPLTAILLLALVVGVGYGRTIHGPFLYDDHPNITGNPHIAITDLSYASLSGAAKNSLSTRPVANLSFAFNYYFHGYNEAGYHIVNILIHLMTGFFVFILARQTFSLCRVQMPAVPLLAALFWFVIPLHTQSVTYIVQRMNSMAAMFYLLALISYIHARKLQVAAGSENKRLAICLFFSGCGLSGLLGLMTKETVATLPVFLFLYEWYFFQSLSPAWLKKQFTWIIGIILVFAGIALIYLNSDHFSRIMQECRHYDFTLSERLLTQPLVIVYYLSLVVFPHPARLNLIYDFPVSHSLTVPPITILSLIALAALMAAAIYTAKRHRLISFAIIWFAGNLIIESSVIGLHLIFEHRTYLPSIFPVMAAVILFSQYLGRRRTAVMILCGAVAINFFWTMQRNDIWRTRLSFWQNQSLKTPRLGLSFNQLGLAYARDKQDYQQAAMMMNHALEINRSRYGEDSPETATVYYDLGEIYRIDEKFNNALAAYGRALSIIQQTAEVGQSNMAALYNSLGTTHKSMGDYDQAVYCYHQALKVLQQESASVRPMDIAGIWNNLGIAYAEQGDYAMAKSYFEKTLNILKEEFGERHPYTRQAEKTLQDLTLKLPGAIEPGAESPHKPPGFPPQ